MRKEVISAWLKIGVLRNKQKDIEKIKAMMNSAEINAKVAKSIKLNKDTATLIFREVYESIRQLGDVKLGLLGFEPGNHEVSMEILKEVDIRDKVKLNSLGRFKKIRHDVNYRGFRTSMPQTEEILGFWDKCGEEILKILRKEIENN